MSCRRCCAIAILSNSLQRGFPCTPSCRSQGRTRSRPSGSLDARRSENEPSPLAGQASDDALCGLEEALRRPQRAAWGTTKTHVRDFGSGSRLFAAPHRSHQATAGLRCRPKPRKLRQESQDTGDTQKQCNINGLEVAVQGVSSEPVSAEFPVKQGKNREFSQNQP